MHISIHVIVGDNHILEGPTTYFLLRQSCPYPYCHLEVLSSDKTTLLGKRQLSSGISHMSLTRGTLLLPPRSSAGIHYGKRDARSLESFVGCFYPLDHGD